jgi:hypothetical protein
MQLPDIWAFAVRYSTPPTVMFCPTETVAVAGAPDGWLEHPVREPLNVYVKGVFAAVVNDESSTALPANWQDSPVGAAVATPGQMPNIAASSPVRHRFLVRTSPTFRSLPHTDRP